jgi:hypothetical protein
MSNIASPWHYDTAAFHARHPLEHAIACDIALRPWPAISDVTIALDRQALNHPSNREMSVVGETRKNYAPFEYFAV